MARKALKGGRPRRRRQYTVFISHASLDKWVAVQICDRLGDEGIKTFRDDRDIDGGDDIPEKIRDGIRGADELVVLYSPASANRRWVLMEVGAAWGRRKGYPITVLLYHETADSIPEMLKSKRALSLNEFDRLLADVKKRRGA